jgi:putative Mg2+ transporter-C (MgtC) family protein
MHLNSLQLNAMTLDLTWQQIALRITLACIASMAIGVNRDEHGRPAGMRTIMLVTLTATLAMLQVNLLLPLAGRPTGSFNQLDLMRLPLGILSGIGFIGAGAIIKKETGAIGVTTAATLWFSTMLGLLFGAGQLGLACTATLIALGILVGLKRLEALLPHAQRGTLTLQVESPTATNAPTEAELIATLRDLHFEIKGLTAEYGPQSQLKLLRCNLQWLAKHHKKMDVPERLSQLRTLPAVTTFRWDQ